MNQDEQVKSKHKQSHLPIYGVGPIFGAVIIALTVAGIVCSARGPLASGNYTVLYSPINAAAMLLLIFGVHLWGNAIFQSKIDDGILNNHLVTSGVYAWVRNPIYSAFLFFCTGALLLAHNLYLLILPPVYWAFLTILMKCTEEKWLFEQYGTEYEIYCKRTNRCIPWFPRNEKQK